MDYKGYTLYMKGLGYTDEDIELILEVIPIRKADLESLRRYLEMRMPAQQIKCILSLFNYDIDGSILESTGLTPTFYETVLAILVTAHDSISHNDTYFTFLHLIKAEIQCLELLKTLEVSESAHELAQEHTLAVLKAALNRIIGGNTVMSVFN